MTVLVESDQSEFWAAVRDTFDREEAHRFIDEEFGFTGPIVEYRDAYRFATRLDPSELLSSRLAAALPSIEVDYTDEAIRTLLATEQQVVDETHREIDEYYD
jgi:hypothetical protein